MSAKAEWRGRAVAFAKADKIWGLDAIVPPGEQRAVAWCAARADAAVARGISVIDARDEAVLVVTGTLRRGRTGRTRNPKFAAVRDIVKTRGYRACAKCSTRS